MPLKGLKEPLRADVMLPKRAFDFEQARSRHEVLAAHSTTASVLAMLADESDRRYFEREALARVLVVEHQRKESPLWASMLMLGFAPMLLRLRGRIVQNTIADDDLDQMVVEAFLETITRFPLAARLGRTAMYVRQDTERAVFRALELDRRAIRGQMLLEQEARHMDDYDVFSGPAKFVVDDRDGMVELLVEHVRGHIDQDSLDVVIATTIDGKRLRRYLSEQLGNVSARDYQRVKRDRTRALRKIRTVLLSPIGGG